jgi:hypothetical protein
MKKVYTILLVLVYAIAAAQSQRTILHVHGAGNDTSETPAAQVIDARGNICVTGTISQGSNLSMLTQRYSPVGTLLWSATFSGTVGGGACDIKTDGRSNLYVAGITSDTAGISEFRVIKYDHNGNIDWVTAFPDTVASWYWSCRLALDNAGNVYAAGMMNHNNLYVLKYDQNGSLLWARRYPPTISYWTWMGRTSIKVDANNDLYIAGGLHHGNNNAKLCLIKYSSSGNLLWTAEDNGSSEWMDHANDLQLDGSGNIYVTGREEYGIEMNNFILMKYDPSGNMIWKKIYNNPSDGGDEPYDVMISADGSVYITGLEDRHTPSLKPYAGTTIKYDANGNELWKLTLGDGSERYVGYRMAEDISKNLYITGYYVSELTANAPGWKRGIFTARVSSAGMVQWVDTCLIDGGGSGIAIDIHPAGGAYVSATMSDTVMDANGYHYFNLALIRYDSDAVSAGEEMPIVNELEVFPNPSQGMITVRTGDKSSAIEIHDLSGRCVYTVKANEISAQNEIDLSHLGAGAYTVRVINGNNTSTRKLLVVK